MSESAIDVAERRLEDKNTTLTEIELDQIALDVEKWFADHPVDRTNIQALQSYNNRRAKLNILLTSRRAAFASDPAVLDAEQDEFNVDNQTWTLERLQKLLDMANRAKDSAENTLLKYQVNYAINELRVNPGDRRSFAEFLEFKRRLQAASPTPNPDAYASLKREYEHYASELQSTDDYGAQAARQKFIIIKQTSQIGAITPEGKRAAAPFNFQATLAAIKRPDGLTLTQAEALLNTVKEQAATLNTTEEDKKAIIEFNSIVVGRRIIVDTALNNSEDFDEHETTYDSVQLHSFLDQVLRAIAAENDDKSANRRKLNRLSNAVSFQISSVDAAVPKRTTYKESKDMLKKAKALIDDISGDVKESEVTPVLEFLKQFESSINTAQVESDIEELQTLLNQIRDRDDEAARSTFGHGDLISAAAAAVEPENITQQLSIQDAQLAYDTKIVELNRIYDDFSLATDESVAKILDGFMEAARVIAPLYSSGSGLTPIEKVERATAYTKEILAFNRDLNRFYTADGKTFTGLANKLRQSANRVRDFQTEEKGAAFVKEVTERILATRDGAHFILDVSGFDLAIARLGDAVPIARGIQTAVDAWNREHPDAQNSMEMQDRIYVALVVRAANPYIEGPGEAAAVIAAIRDQGIKAGRRAGKDSKDVASGLEPTSNPRAFVTPAPVASPAKKTKAPKQTTAQRARDAAPSLIHPTPVQRRRSAEYKADEYSHLWLHIQDALGLIGVNFNDPINQTPNLTNGAIARFIVAASTTPGAVSFPAEAFTVDKIPIEQLTVDPNSTTTKFTLEQITATSKKLMAATFRLRDQPVPADNDKRTGYMKLICSLNTASAQAIHLLDRSWVGEEKRKKNRAHRVYKTFLGPILYNCGLSAKFKKEMETDDETQDDYAESIERCLAIARSDINGEYGGLIKTKDVTVEAKIKTLTTSRNKVEANETKRQKETMPRLQKELKEATDASTKKRLNATIKRSTTASRDALAKIDAIDKEIKDLGQYNASDVVDKPTQHKGIDELGPQVMILLSLMRDDMPALIGKVIGEPGGQHQARLFTRTVWTFACIVFWGLYEEMSSYKNFDANDQPWVFGAWVALDLVRKTIHKNASLSNHLMTYYSETKAITQKSGFKITSPDTPSTDVVLFTKLLDEMFFEYMRKRLVDVPKHTSASAAIPTQADTLRVLLEDQVRLHDLFRANPTTETKSKATPSASAPAKKAPTPSGTPLKGPKTSDSEAAAKRRADIGEVKDRKELEAKIASGKVKFGKNPTPPEKDRLPRLLAHFARADKLWFILKSRPAIGGDADVPSMEYVFTRASDRKWLFDPEGSFDARVDKAVEHYPRYILNRGVHVYLQSLWLRYIMMNLDKPASVEARRSDARTAIAFTPAPVLSLNTSPPVEEKELTAAEAAAPDPDSLALADINTQLVSSQASDGDNSILGNAPASVIGSLGGSQSDQIQYTPNPLSPLSPSVSIAPYRPVNPQFAPLSSASTNALALDTSVLDDFGFGNDDDDNGAAAVSPERAPGPLPAPVPLPDAAEEQRLLDEAIALQNEIVRQNGIALTKKLALMRKLREAAKARQAKKP